ncbi:MAG: hypothetical protein Q8Q14_03050 [Gemmatimonadales bacterium]|nr:hypothetical protein [Gemmatimonadales bacterium]
MSDTRVKLSIPIPRHVHRRVEEIAEITGKPLYQVVLDGLVDHIVRVQSDPDYRAGLEKQAAQREREAADMRARLARLSDDDDDAQIEG